MLNSCCLCCLSLFALSSLFCREANYALMKLPKLRVNRRQELFFVCEFRYSDGDILAL